MRVTETCGPATHWFGIGRFSIILKLNLPHRYGSGQFGWLANTSGLMETGAWENGRISGMGEVEVKLPVAPQGVPSALMKNNTLHRPLILPPWDPDDGADRFYFHQGENASIMIRGSDLWHHPKVYLGT